MDVVQFLRRRGGAARTAQLLRAGYPKSALAKGVRNGTVNVLRRGIYTIEGADPVIIAALQANGVLTCVSAARFYNLWQLHEPGGVQGSRSSQRSEGLHLSCGNGLVRDGVVDHARCTHPGHPYLPVAGLADVLIHALRCRPELESLVIAQSAISRGLITTDFLNAKLLGNRNGAARAVLDLVLPRADSLLEVLAHTHFVRAGLRVRMHVELAGVGEADCLINECLVVELDGRTHLEARQVKKDRYRDNASVRGGLLALHYYYEDVVHRPEEMVNEILTVLRHREVGHFAPARYAPGWVPPS
ncbi:type IV toxin-antitoxin system AbiEi family antitoxin domain-containing protein [Arthrobacter sp. B2a2-09]|uniref:type IV toxin-antitoxin system AbiEi family antitoxin domain-containing protein n=1 Tax=Arthrobacter sp. B2a2-09 TaxID=2952822 RepID=UPI0022CD3B00|nr:type IV toxin-antitoxin system AbiEi family antitoxin domain-containing protein [Arthrobacter sp. B2a2-09]MCZ9882393.1 type IV toxin-antitoxin system AbiEi family antitoxin domain-containing protein [Arthrobacter sp. B2a2-09]